MGDYGIKISKPGYDIKTTGLQNQVFNSSANSLKIWMTGSSNISVAAWDGSGSNEKGTVDITHSLGYAPFYLCYFKLKHATKLWLQDSLDISMLTGNYIDGRAYSNNTNLHCGIWVNGNNLDAWTATVYYLIFIDKAIT